MNENKPNHEQSDFHMTSYTPDGIVRRNPITHIEPEEQAAIHNLSNNTDIFTTLSEHAQHADEPLPVSSAYETQMRFNMQMARIEYSEKRNTPEAVEAARHYREQREAFTQYQSAVRNGTFSVKKPEPAPSNPGRQQSQFNSPEQPDNHTPAPHRHHTQQNTPYQNYIRQKTHSDPNTIFTYSPSGMNGASIENGRLSHSGYQYSNKSPYRDLPLSQDNPLQVSPEYEKQMYDRMSRSSAVLSQISQTTADGGIHQISGSHADEIRFTTDAYLGFQKAKNDGLVVISPTAEISEPDYDLWHHRQQQYSGRIPKQNDPALGSTQTDWRVNPNKVKKEQVEEISADLFNRESRLKNKSISSYYLHSIGARIEDKSVYITSALSRSIYGLTQTGEDNPIRTIETARFYGNTAVLVGSSIHNAAPVWRMARAGEKLAKEEFKMFGTLTKLSKTELATNISEHKKLAQANKAQIKALYNKHHELSNEISYLQGKGINRTAAEQTKFHSLLIEKTRTREQIVYMTKFHADNSLQLRKEIGLQKRIHKDELQVKIAKDLKSEHRGMVTTKHIHAKMGQVEKEANARMAKKFGKLSKVSDKSLKLEISELTQQAKEIKSQIKLLQSKGSKLTQSERLKLSTLMKKHKEISGSLRKYHGLRLERASLKEQLDVYRSLSKRLAKNTGARRSGFFALRSIIFKPINEGSEIGAQGLTQGFTIASNRHVRALLKKSLKLSYLSAKATMNIVIPGSVETIDASLRLTKEVVKVQTRVAINSSKAAVKTGVKSAARVGKRAVVKVTPPQIRTAATKTHSAVLKSNRKFRQIWVRGKNWFADSALGRSLSFVKRASSSTAQAIKAVTTVLKSIAVKALAVFVVLFLIVGLISVFATNFTTGSASSVILSPYIAESGKIDLNPYVEILNKKQAEFDAVIAGFKNSKKYDDVVVNAGNGSLNNFQEILSMMAVFFGQDLDLEKNPKVKLYLESLYDASNTYSTRIEYFRCAGEDCETKKCETEDCKTKKCENEDCKYTLEFSPCDETCPPLCSGNHKEKVYYCPGNHPYCPGNHPYCPGKHERLHVTVNALTFDEIFTADTMGNAMGNAVAGTKIGNFKITHYCSCKICCGKTDGITATGTKATANRTIAVDPDIIPLGSHVIIDGKEYVAEDTGGAINENRIDIYVETHAKALELGVRNSVPVYWPSYEGEGVQETGNWEGWTDANILWAKTIFSTNWSELYEGGVLANGGIIFGGDLIVDGDFVWPVTTTSQSSGYGWRVDPFTGERSFHKGTDIPVPTGTAVYAAAAGTVTTSTYHSAAGNYIVIDHGNGIVTRYLHNSKLLVKRGDTVTAGQLIAASGNTGSSTGPHLHFEFIVNGTPIDPRAQYKLN